ncbi:MAG: S46 family peptidase [Alistipes sp.]|nr:S46 family peptidase [Alistipes sp.]
MKKLFLCLAAAVVSLTASADEGMWLLPYLQKMNIGDMRAKGCELTAEQIYSINGSSLKDAIVIFGNGCTGEVVSPEGLVFTNHHCGYASIQELSSVEHDYLKDGFWASSNADELPAPGLTVTFIRQILDVTPEVLGSVPSIAGGSERVEIVERNIEALRERLAAEYPGKTIAVKSFFGGNQYFAFVQDIFRDIRLVGTPPSSIGKFGGETDNWMWPRHTGDFSIFRIYADKENNPAAYSPENVPYRAENHLKISLDGIEENDFAMIMGFPGSTQRYMTSYEIDELLNVTGPQRVAIRGARQEILKKDMLASDKVRIQYASKYAGSSNYWKNTIGMMRGVKKLDVKAKKEAQEAAFQVWADANTLPEEGFSDALPTIREALEQSRSCTASLQYLSEALGMAVEIISPAISAHRILNAEEVTDELKQRLEEYYVQFYKDYNMPTDRKVAKRMLAMVRENVEELPSVFAEVIDARFGGDIDAYVDYLYDNSAFTSYEKATAVAPDQVAEDPAVVLAESVIGKMGELRGKMTATDFRFADGHRRYIAGLMRMQPDKAFYPDANFTLRMTYGQVLPYEPMDGVKYEYYTTLKGVMEKENPENPEFVVPAKLRELYEKKDFGRWANRDGELPVAFLANCDITGGNSGSPMMNGRGELIGLAFDGNWEAMSGDIAFEPEVQRTIGVDVRYVLFLIDKFADSGWLLEEMTLVGGDCGKGCCADKKGCGKKAKKAAKKAKAGKK